MAPETPILSTNAPIEGRILVSTSPARSTYVWLMTFGDMVLLLLTFFVMLFAMSDIDLRRYGALAGSTGQAVMAPDVAAMHSPAMDIAIPQHDLRPGEKLGYLKAVITNALSQDERFGQVSTRLTEEYLVVSLPNSLMFDPGSAKASELARSVLFDLAGQLNALDNAIAVTGHVGPAGLGDAPFLSKWELSLVRAVVVSDIMRQSGYAGSLTVLGRSDNDYRSRSAKLPPLAKAVLAATSDRVDIVIFPYRAKV